MNVQSYEEELAASKTRRFFEAMFAAVTMVNAFMNFISLLMIALARFRAQRENNPLVSWSELQTCCTLPILLGSCLLFLASSLLALVALLTNLTGTPGVLPPEFGIQFRSNWSYAAVYYSWPQKLQIGNVTLDDKVKLFPHINISLTQQNTSYYGTIAKYLDTTIWKWPEGTFNFTYLSFNQSIPCTSVLTQEILESFEPNFGMLNIKNCTVLLAGWWTNTIKGLKLHIRYGYEVKNDTSCKCGNFSGGKVVKQKLQWSNSTWQIAASKICVQNLCNGNCESSEFSMNCQPEIFCTGKQLGLCKKEDSKQNISLESQTATNLTYSTQNSCLCGCNLGPSENCTIEVSERDTCETVRTGPLHLNKKRVCAYQSSCSSKPASTTAFTQRYPAQNEWLLILEPFVRCGLKYAPPEVIEDQMIDLPCTCY